MLLDLDNNEGHFRQIVTSLKAQSPIAADRPAENPRETPDLMPSPILRPPITPKSQIAVRTNIPDSQSYDLAIHTPCHFHRTGCGVGVRRIVRGLALVALLDFSPLIRHVDLFHVLRSHFNVVKVGVGADGFCVEGSEGLPVDLIQSVGRGLGVFQTTSPV